MLPEEGQLQLLCSCFMPKRMLQSRWPSYIQEYVYVAIRMIMLHAKRTVAMMMAMLHASWDVAIHSFCCMQDGRWLSAMQPVSEPSTSTPRPSLTRCTKQNQIYIKNYQMNMQTECYLRLCALLRIWFLAFLGDRGDVSEPYSQGMLKQLNKKLRTMFFLLSVRIRLHIHTLKLKRQCQEFFWTFYFMNRTDLRS